MGFFSKKPSPTPTTRTTPTPAPTPLPTPGPVGLQQLAEAKAFMAQWVHIIGQASDPVFWGALAQFGRIGGAVQAENSHSGNMRIFDTAKNRFNNDFRAMFDWPWRTWLEVAKKANEVNERELPVQIFFFAWAIKNQVKFDMNTSALVGFEHPSTATFKAIAGEAMSAAAAAPADFAVIERATESPVPRAAILQGTSQILGIAPPG